MQPYTVYAYPWRVPCPGVPYQIRSDQILCAASYTVYRDREIEKQRDTGREAPAETDRDSKAERQQDSDRKQRRSNVQVS
jgi:hypothetical protein